MNKILSNMLVLQRKLMYCPTSNYSSLLLGSQSWHKDFSTSVQSPLTEENHVIWFPLPGENHVIWSPLPGEKAYVLSYFRLL